MRNVITALVSAALLSACGPQAEKNAEPPAPAAAPLVAWADLSPEQITVGQGVTYTTSNGTARIAGVPQDAGAGGATGGVGVRLPDTFEQSASGRHIRVTVRASSPDAGALLGAAYSTADVGNSGWRTFPLTGEPADYTFEYDVPVLSHGNGDFLGFRSYGDAAVLISGFKTEIVEAAPDVQTAPSQSQ